MYIYASLHACACTYVNTVMWIHSVALVLCILLIKGNWGDHWVPDTGRRAPPGAQTLGQQPPDRRRQGSHARHQEVRIQLAASAHDPVHTHSGLLLDCEGRTGQGRPSCMHLACQVHHQGASSVTSAVVGASLATSWGTSPEGSAFPREASGWGGLPCQVPQDVLQAVHLVACLAGELPHCSRCRHQRGAGASQSCRSVVDSE